MTLPRFFGPQVELDKGVEEGQEDPSTHSRAVSHGSDEVLASLAGKYERDGGLSTQSVASESSLLEDSNDLSGFVIMPPQCGCCFLPFTNGVFSCPVCDMDVCGSCSKLRVTIEGKTCLGPRRVCMTCADTASPPDDSDGIRVLSREQQLYLSQSREARTQRPQGEVEHDLEARAIWNVENESQSSANGSVRRGQRIRFDTGSGNGTARGAIGRRRSRDGHVSSSAASVSFVDEQGDPLSEGDRWRLRLQRQRKKHTKGRRRSRSTGGSSVSEGDEKHMFDMFIDALAAPGPHMRRCSWESTSHLIMFCTTLVAAWRLFVWSAEAPVVSTLSVSQPVGPIEVESNRVEGLTPLVAPVHKLVLDASLEDESLLESRARLPETEYTSLPIEDHADVKVPSEGVLLHPLKTSDDSIGEEHVDQQQDVPSYSMPSALRGAKHSDEKSHDDSKGSEEPVYAASLHRVFTMDVCAPTYAYSYSAGYCSSSVVALWQSGDTLSRGQKIVGYSSIDDILYAFVVESSGNLSLYEVDAGGEAGDNERFVVGLASGKKRRSRMGRFWQWLTRHPLPPLPPCNTCKLSVERDRLVLRENKKRRSKVVWKAKVKRKGGLWRRSKDEHIASISTDGNVELINTRSGEVVWSFGAR